MGTGLRTGSRARILSLQGSAGGERKPSVKAIVTRRAAPRQGPRSAGDRPRRKAMRERELRGLCAAYPIDFQGVTR
jgi:hypothetical protein